MKAFLIVLFLRFSHHKSEITVRGLQQWCGTQSALQIKIYAEKKTFSYHFLLRFIKWHNPQFVWFEFKMCMQFLLKLSFCWFFWDFIDDVCDTRLYSCSFSISWCANFYCDWHFHLKRIIWSGRPLALNERERALHGIWRETAGAHIIYILHFHWQMDHAHYQFSIFPISWQSMWTAAAAEKYRALDYISWNLIVV